MSFWRRNVNTRTRCGSPQGRGVFRRHSGSDSLWTHNDWDASNFLWSDSGAVAAVRTVLNCAASDRTTAVYDLGGAIVRNTIPWRDIREGRRANPAMTWVSGLLKGYLSGAKLTGPQRAADVAILSLVHLEHAQKDIEFHVGAQGKTEANSAYHKFLLGHADWGAGPSGQALIDSLSREPERGG